MLVPSFVGVRMLWRSVGNAEIVHCHGFRNGLVLSAVLLARARGRRVVLQPHGAADVIGVGRTRKRVFDAVVDPALARCVSAFVSLTEDESDIIRIRFPRVEVHRVRNPIPRRAGAVISPSRTPPYLLFVGRLNWKKGIVELVSSWAASSLPLGLKVIGPSDGIEERELRRIAEAAGRTDELEILGALGPDEVRHAMAGSAAVIVPSLVDTAPMVIFEAISLGRPAVVRRSVEVLNGWESLCDAVMTFRTDEELVGAIERALSTGQNFVAIDSVMAEVSPSVVEKSVREVYRCALT